VTSGDERIQIQPLSLRGPRVVERLDLVVAADYAARR